MTSSLLLGTLALLLLSASITAAPPTSSSLYSLLDSIRYLNNGTVSRSHNYGYSLENVGYGEPENVSTVNADWGVGGAFPILYQDDGQPSSPCSPQDVFPGYDFPGDDITTVVLQSVDVKQCQALCCDTPGCAALTVTVAPTHFMNCNQGDACCYLKAGIADREPSSLPNITSATVTPQRSPFTIHPPTGMRSAVPVGGVSGGSVELRADGTFHEWTIVNQSPGGAAKYGVVGDALMFAGVDGSDGSRTTALLRTQPPYSLPGVESMRYQGSYPAARLDVLDAALPVEMSVYAYYRLKPTDLIRSVAPAFVLSANVRNPSSSPINATFGWTLPFGIETDQLRSGKPIKNLSTETADDCLQQCAQASTCASWTFDLASTNCQLNSDVPLNYFQGGAASGVSGMWKWTDAVQTGSTSGTAAAGSPLQHVRPFDPTGPTHGDVSLWPVVDSGDGNNIDYSFRYFVSESVTDLHSRMSSGQTLQSRSGSAAAAMGAASVTASLQPGQTATLSIVFSWYFPNRDHVGLNVGNYYSNLFSDSLQVAEAVVSTDGEGLPAVVRDIVSLHSIFLDTDLPVYLQDSLINSFSHVRSAMYTRDGTWRQWEAYDCVDVDSVHNDYQRHLPYILYFSQHTHRAPLQRLYVVCCMAC